MQFFGFGESECAGYCGTLRGYFAAVRRLVVRGMVPGAGALAFVRRNSLVWGLFDLPDPAGAEGIIEYALNKVI